MIVLSIALSEACNLNCTYCNVDKQSKLSIDPNKFLDTFKQVRERSPDERIQVDFYGGEPLIYYNKIQYIIEHLQDDNIQFFMPTNGLLLTADRLAYLNKHKVKISLSYDGLWQDRNRPRGLMNKKTSHVFAEKQSLFRSIPNFYIHSMIYPGCYNLLENHIFLTEYGANPQLTVVEDRKVWDTLSVERLKHGINELFDWYIADPINRELPNTIKYYLNSIILFKSKKYETKYCGAGESHLSFSDDKLVACNRFKNEPHIQAQIPIFIEMSACQTCEVKNYCRKGCMYENIHNGGPIEEVCTIIKHFISRTQHMIKTLQNNEAFVHVLKTMIKEEYGINN